MGKKPPYVPSQLTLLKTRVARALGDFSEDTFIHLETTFYTVKLMYAGHTITYQVKDIEGKGERLVPRPKEPAGLLKEDMDYLNNFASMEMRRYRDQLARAKAHREEVAELERKAEEAQLFLERSKNKTIGTGSDQLEKERQHSFIPDTKEKQEASIKVPPSNKETDGPPF